MAIEHEVESLVLGLDRRELTPHEIHEVLRRIAELVGDRPQSVLGPGPLVEWRAGDRAIVVSAAVSVRGRGVSVCACDWAERDDEYYRWFQWAEGTTLPYLWGLSVAGREWWPGARIATGWDGFFDYFGPCLDELPGDLLAVPPEWRPSGAAVLSMWNVDGPGVGGVSVEVSADGAVVIAHGPADSGFELRVPADRLGMGQVSVPAVLASLTASGSYAELQFWENDTRMDVFPEGRRADDEDGDLDADLDGDLEDDPSPDAEAPATTMTIDEARALLAAPPPAPRERRREKRRTARFTPTLPAGHAAELAGQLARHRDDAPAVLRAWGVELDERGRGSLGRGPVRCRAGRDGDQAVSVTLVREGRRPVDDPGGAWAYGHQLSAALTEGVRISVGHLRGLGHLGQPAVARERDRPHGPDLRARGGPRRGRLAARVPRPRRADVTEPGSTGGASRVPS